MKIEDNMQLHDEVSTQLAPAVQTYILKIEFSYVTKVHLGDITIEEAQAMIAKYLVLWEKEEKSSEFRVNLQKETK